MPRRRPHHLPRRRAGRGARAGRVTRRARGAGRRGRRRSCRRSSSSAAARTCSSPTPGSPASASCSTASSSDLDLRVDAGHAPGRRRGAPSPSWPAAAGRRRPHRARVLRGDPGQRRRRGPDERRRPRPGDRRRARRAPRSPTSPPGRADHRPTAAGARPSATAARPSAQPRWSPGPRSAVADGDAAAAEAEVAEIVRWRREHQPGGANAGSVFPNPPGDSAGRLIDALGLKGLRVGGAVVSAKHANFFQAEAGATADDVRAPRARGAATGARRHRRSRSCPSCAWSASTTTRTTWPRPTGDRERA